MLAEKGHKKTFSKINSFKLRLLKNNINLSKKKQCLNKYFND